EVKLPLFSP
ncbi:hypothetical protein VCHENC01_4133B, partial [Vibrio harveyi]